VEFAEAMSSVKTVPALTNNELAEKVSGLLLV
jgi:hypothetical protein